MNTTNRHATPRKHGANLAWTRFKGNAGAKENRGKLAPRFT